MHTRWLFIAYPVINPPFYASHLWIIYLEPLLFLSISLLAPGRVVTPCCLLSVHNFHHQGPKTKHIKLQYLAIYSWLLWFALIVKCAI